MHKIDFSVIIPTYNEKDNIPVLVEAIQKAIKDIRHEIIIVDDNSPDGTWKVAEKLQKSNPALTVIRRINERGLSSAVITGMSVAKGNVFAVIDADMQHDESILPLLYNAVQTNGVDVAIGSRGVEGGSYGNWSKKRRLISWVAATMARIVLKDPIKDPMSGFFAISKDFYSRVADKINPRGFKILLEFVARADRPGVKEIGFTFRNRVHGETKLSGSVIRNYIIALYDLKFGKYISPTFFLYSLVGLSGVFVNLLGFAIGEWAGLPRIHTGILGSLDPLFLSVPFGIQISILSNYLINNYFTFYETRRKGKGHIKGFFLFETVSLLGLVIQTGVFQLLYTNQFMFFADGEVVSRYFSNAAGIIAATASNYYLNANLTWEKNSK